MACQNVPRASPLSVVKKHKAGQEGVTSRLSVYPCLVAFRIHDLRRGTGVPADYSETQEAHHPVDTPTTYHTAYHCH